MLAFFSPGCGGSHDYCLMMIGPRNGPRIIADYCPGRLTLIQLFGDSLWTRVAAPLLDFRPTFR